MYFLVMFIFNFNVYRLRIHLQEEVLVWEHFHANQAGSRRLSWHCNCLLCMHGVSSIMFVFLEVELCKDLFINIWDQSSGKREKCSVTNFS